MFFIKKDTDTKLVIVTIACVVSAKAQGGLLGNILGKVGPKCGDGSKPTCTCRNGDVITRYTTVVFSMQNLKHAMFSVFQTPS